MLIDAALYRNGRRLESATSLEDVRRGCGEPDTFAWIGLLEPDADEFDEVRTMFDLHELAVRDALAPHHRPTLESYDGSHLLVVKTATYVDATEVVDIGEIRVFFGPDFVVAVRYGAASPMAEARAQLERRHDLLRLGPAAVVHGMLEHVIEDYVPVLDGLDNDIGELEEQVFSDARNRPTERIYMLNREVLAFHRAAAPLRGPIERMLSDEIEWIPDELHPRLVDIQGDLARAVEQIEGCRDLLTTILDANLTQVNIQQNDDMRKISAWVAMAAVPAAIGGIYGMNFRDIPFADEVAGFPVALAIMALTMLVLWRAFRRSGWV